MAGTGHPRALKASALPAKMDIKEDRKDGLKFMVFGSESEVQEC